MRAGEIIEAALGRGQKALSEYESKRVLSEYGVPVTREKLVRSAGEAAAAAEELGWPAVVKACAPDLMHKSEGGLVALGLKSPAEVERAFDRMAPRVDFNTGGVLVQETVPGNRELVIGLTRDAQFGPCVMLGLGGVMTEILNDAVFRMAPVDRLEATDMVEELRSRALLGEFRGQARADLEAVFDALTGVGRIGLEFDTIAEIDVNPLIIGPDGSVKAVDALVVLQKG